MSRGRDFSFVSNFTEMYFWLLFFLKGLFGGKIVLDLPSGFFFFQSLIGGKIVLGLPKKKMSCAHLSFVILVVK